MPDPSTAVPSNTVPQERVQALRELTALLPGQVHLPGKPGWDDNPPQRVAAIVSIDDDEDVVAAVSWAARSGFAVTVQPESPGVTDGVVLLRMKGLSSIVVDAGQGVARVGAGVTWAQLLAATSDLGVTALAGGAGDRSVVEHTLGAGLGWFGRSYGLAAHSVLAVELVDANGRFRRITPGVDRDLFWALRGGGSDFGIVTSIEIELHPAPLVHAGRMLWPIEMAGSVLRTFRDLADSAPDELNLWAGLLRDPLLPDRPEPWPSASFVSVDVLFLGPSDLAETLLAPLRALPEAPVLDTTGPVTLAELADVWAESAGAAPMCESSLPIITFDDEAIDTLLADTSDDLGLRFDRIQVHRLGATFTRATSTDGPIGAITQPYHLTWRPGWSEAVTGESDWPAIDPSVRARLQLVKLAVDPTDVIRGHRTNSKASQA
jgi:hypothetical protein